MIKILHKILKILSQLTLKRYQPKIIGITGSVGKTSAKEAIFLVLNQEYNVRRNINNYNNEIGVPLTILGEKSPGSSIIGWTFVFIKSVLKIIYTNYPQILVLEMGIDKPGDMDYLTNFVKPDIAVVTSISEIPVHLENFKNIQQLAKEKLKIITDASNDNYAVINSDNKNILKYLPEIEQKIIKFGLKEGADIRASNVLLDSKELMLENGVRGLSFKLHYEKSSLPVRLPNVLAEHQIYAALAAVACGMIFKMNLIKIAEVLKELRPPKGRLNIIQGVKGTTIIDDSYNSSPDSTAAALRLTDKLSSGGRKIAVLGDMKELGDKTKQAHQEIGRIAAKVADILVAVGKEALFIARAAKERGMPKNNIYTFSNSEDAGRFIQNNILKPNDLVLVKGSQAIRTEKIVKEIMAEPMKADELIVRQDKNWLKK